MPAFIVSIIAKARMINEERFTCDALGLTGTGDFREW